VNLIYVPSVDKCFFYWRTVAGGGWYYDPAKNDWGKIDESGERPTWGYSAVGCYDPKRDRIYVGGGISPTAAPGRTFNIFDVKTSKWIQPDPKGKLPTVDYHNHVGMMHYDVAADRVVLFIYGRPRDIPDPRGIHAYDPDKNEWTAVQEKAAGALVAKTNSWTGFYDPILNVHFLHAASDSKDNGSMWAYRHKKQ
ncbi:MAG: hypothetical protein ACYTGB_03835, partial [Planctomycetota bacterium]|jgi:hypothetical protein